MRRGGANDPGRDKEERVKKEKEVVIAKYELTLAPWSLKKLMIRC